MFRKNKLEGKSYCIANKYVINWKSEYIYLESAVSDN